MALTETQFNDTTVPADYKSFNIYAHNHIVHRAQRDARAVRFNSFTIF